MTRRRLVCGVFAAMALVAALKLLSVGWFSAAGVNAYEDGHYESSADDFGRLESSNVIEPWRAPYNRGVALYHDDDLDGAADAFRRARDAAPHRCDVLTNLVLTVETQGDRLRAGGDADSARDHYAAARALSDELPCPIGDDAEQRDPAVVLDDARVRLDAKLSAAEPESEPDTSSPTTTAPTTTAAPTDPDPSQQQQLQDLADLSAEAHNERASGDDDRDEGPETGGW